MSIPFFPGRPRKNSGSYFRHPSNRGAVADFGEHYEDDTLPHLKRMALRTAGIGAVSAVSVVAAVGLSQIQSDHKLTSGERRGMTGQLVDSRNVVYTALFDIVCGGPFTEQTSALYLNVEMLLTKIPGETLAIKSGFELDNDKDHCQSVVNPSLAVSQQIRRSVLDMAAQSEGVNYIPADANRVEVDIIQASNAGVAFDTVNG